MDKLLMLAFQRPSDAASKLLQRIAEGPCVEVGLVYEWVGNVPESVWDELIGNDLLNRYTATWAPGSPDHFRITRLGRLVLAACDTDAPDPVGKVVGKELIEAVEMCWGYFDQCCLDQRNMVPNADGMRKMLRATLDAATDKAGEVG